MLLAFFIMWDLVHLLGMKRMILSLLLIFVCAFGVTLPSLGGNSKVYAQGINNTSGTAGGSKDNIGEAACNSVGTQKDTCTSCFNGGGVWTALGCWNASSVDEFIASFVKLATGLGGGIAMLLILFSGLQRIMSAGNPEKLNEAKELMTAAISGLLLIIFSIFLLRLIGVDILKIPGLG